MPDPKRFRRRVLYRLANSPITLVPFAGGVAALVVGGIVLGSPLAAFGGVVGMLAGVGALATRFIMGNDKVAQLALEDLETQDARRREQELDRLERDLRRDGDPRTEQLLRDLRQLVRPFVGTQGGDVPLLEGTPAALSFDIGARAHDLFLECTRLLRQSLELWRTAQGVGTQAAAQPILDRREALVQRVREGVEQLGRSLATLQTLGAGPEGEDELERVRRELDESLDIARRVDEEMRSLAQPGYVPAEFEEIDT